MDRRTERAVELEVRARQLKAQIRAIRRSELPATADDQHARWSLKSQVQLLKEDLARVKAEQARVLGIRVITQPRRQGDHSSNPHPQARQHSGARPA